MNHGCGSDKRQASNESKLALCSLRRRIIANKGTEDDRGSGERFRSVPITDY
uniref:Uncharacterized protein n=1 Tax=Nelumbo nucifera TaxID=4432 RepID=A0A822ZV07_NELNU|nr:TPA_asm: hypothetical protein HUJ06_018740 [Nelumbo nucifera]